MTPPVSAGSSQVGASDMCVPQTSRVLELAAIDPALLPNSPRAAAAANALRRVSSGATSRGRSVGGECDDRRRVRCIAASHTEFGKLGGIWSTTSKLPVHRVTKFEPQAGRSSKCSHEVTMTVCLPHEGSNWSEFFWIFRCRQMIVDNVHLTRALPAKVSQNASDGGGSWLRPAGHCTPSLVALGVTSR